MTNLKTLALAVGLLASPMIAQVQQNPQPPKQEAQPCKPAPKTPDAVNRQVVKQSAKWRSIFNRAIVKSTGGALDASDIPSLKLPAPKPCPAQPQTPNPPAPAAPAPAK